MEPGVSESPSLDIGRFGVVLKRRWRVVVLGVLLGLLAAGALFVLSPPKATAVTLANADVIPAEPFAKDRPASDLIDAETEAQIARSSTVTTSVSDSLGGDMSPAEVRRATTATLLPNGTVMRIEFTADTKSQAVEGADLVARAYLDYRSELAQDKVDASLDQLTKGRTELAAELATLQQQLREATTAEAKSRVQSQLSVVNGTLTSMSSQLSELQSLDTTGGTVLSSAGGASLSPSPSILVLGGLLGGLLLGIVLAFLVNTLDRRVWDDYQIEKAGGGKVLARLRDRVAWVPAGGNDAHAVRTVRERLIGSLSAEQRVVAIAGVGRRWMPSDLAVNLAIACSQVGVKVHLVLVDQSQAFLRDVSAVLAVSSPSTESLRTSSSNAYRDLIVTTTTVDALEEANAADQLIDLLHGGPALSDHLTLVAIPYDAPRALQLSTGRFVDAFILVIARRDATMKQVETLSAELLSVNSTIDGSVLVPAKRRFATRVSAVPEGKRWGRRPEGATERTPSSTRR